MAFRKTTDSSTAPQADLPRMDSSEPGAAVLGTGLKQRHVTMLAISGVIGAGLFLGAGAGIHAAGPGILISYCVAGLLMVLVMRMLAEMAVDQPNSGSFSVYAEKAFGRWAGFTIGWLYWSGLVVVVAAEATGAGAIAHSWLPGVPQWVFVLASMAALTVVNLFDVGRFGEFEFWFGAVKVTAVVAFLVLGALAVFGLLPDTHAVGLTNLTGHGGFLPNGIGGVMTGLLAVVFAFGGVELVTIAAAESANPREALRKTTRTVVARLLLFYIGSVALMVLLLPWDSASATTSPFVAVLDRIGIPAAAQLMNVVVLTSLLSALNSNLYGASRIGFSLAQRGEAPRGLLHVSAAGVPRRAVLASVAFGFVTVILNVFAPDHVLPFLLNTLGAMVLVIWMAIALSQIRLRHLANRTPGETPTVRMWGHPWLSWTAVAGMTGVLALMCTDDDARSQLISTATLTALIIVAAVIRNIVTKNESKA